MQMLLVPIPLFNREMSVEYYCFRFQKGGNKFLTLQVHELDGTVLPPLMDIINKVGLEALTTGKPLFVPISHIALLSNLESQCKESPKNIVFIVSKDTPVEEDFINQIQRLKDLGYRFACHSKMDMQYHLPIIRLCDFIFISVKSKDFKKKNASLKNKCPNIIVIPTDIDTAHDFESAKKEGFKLFEGPFYRLPLSKGQTKVSPLKVNYINLLNIARNENFDINKIALTVQRDTALAISLLKMVNSLGMSQKIESIEFATALLGELELRKWITAVVTNMLAADKPNEITKLTLIRAKFAENIAPKFGLAMQSQNLFLMGLFSALDLILDMPMNRALNVIQVPDEVRRALLVHSGELYPVLELIVWYETADWINTSRSLIINKMDPSDLYDAYLASLSWYNTLIAPVD